MFKCKRWLGLVLCLVMSISMMLPVSAVDPLSTGFASFLIHANTTDSPEVNLHIKLYRRGSSGLFLADDAVRYDCRVNRAAGRPRLLYPAQGRRGVGRGGLSHRPERRRHL